MKEHVPAGAGEAGGQGGPWPPNKILNDAFLLQIVIYFTISYYVKEAGAVIAGFCCLFYNKILLNLT